MRLQSGSPGLAVGDADNRYLRLTGGTLAGNLNVGSGRIVATAPAGTIPQSGDPSAGQTLEHTWNGAGNTWTAFQVNVTDTASASASKLADLQIGGLSKFSIDKYGGFTGGYLRANGTDGVKIMRDAAKLVFEAIDATGNTAIVSPTLGALHFTNGSGSLRDWKARRGTLTEYIDMEEMTAPAAPAANTARLYVEDNGSGKTRLMVLFPSGAAQQVAIEP